MNNVLRGVLTGVVAVVLLVVVSTAEAVPPADPTLALSPVSAQVGQTVTVTGADFPKRAAVFVITAQVAPVFSGAFPSILTETDKTGALEVVTSFDEVGTYELHACFRFKQHGGGWDCRSVDTVSIGVN